VATCLARTASDNASRPQGTASVEWQSVGRELQSFERNEEIGDVERFLVQEFCRYLKEEGLGDEEAISAATAFALAAQPSAERTLARLTEIADGYIRAAWGKPTSFLKRAAQRSSRTMGLYGGRSCA
jgi:hypothetical protein